jgi:hypothetical protein
MTTPTDAKVTEADLELARNCVERMEGRAVALAHPDVQIIAARVALARQQERERAARIAEGFNRDAWSARNDAIAAAIRGAEHV